jgi:hypothetical protein
MGEPNGDDGLVAETTNQFRNDYDDWYKQARQLTVQEATDDKMILTESRIKKEILLSIENSSKNGISQFRVKRDKENDVSNQSTVMEGDEECVASSLGKRSRELEDESNMNSHESNSSRLSTSFSRLKSAKSNNASN